MLSKQQSQLSSSSVWLTGGSGFIGSHILELLVSTKIKHVTLLSAGNIVRPKVTRISQQISRVELDFNNQHHLFWIRDNNSLTTPHYLILNGWGQVNKPESIAHLNENVMNVVNFFGVVPRSDLKKVVFLGSIEEYGKRYGHIKEGDPSIPPMSSYAAGKTLAGLKLSQTAHQSNVPMQHCFVSNVYGPRQRDLSLLSQLKKSDSFTFIGKSYYRDYIFVEDLVAVLLELLQSSDSTPINIGSGVPTHCYDFVETAWRILGKDPSKLSFKYPEVRDKTMMKCFDISKLKRVMPDNLLLQDVENGLLKTLNKP